MQCVQSNHLYFRDVDISARNINIKNTQFTYRKITSRTAPLKNDLFTPPPPDCLRFKSVSIELSPNHNSCKVVHCFYIKYLHNNSNTIFFLAKKREIHLLYQHYCHPRYQTQYTPNNLMPTLPSDILKNQLHWMLISRMVD